MWVILNNLRRTHFVFSRNTFVHHTKDKMKIVFQKLFSRFFIFDLDAKNYWQFILSIKKIVICKIKKKQMSEMKL